MCHWLAMDLQQLDPRTRKLLSMLSVHHPVTDIDHLTPSAKDSRMLQLIDAMYQLCIVGLDCYRL